SRRDLVQHRAEEVIIPFINQRDADWSVAQRMRCGESSETTTDDNYMRRHKLDLAESNILMGWDTRLLGFLIRSDVFEAYAKPHTGSAIQRAEPVTSRW